MAIETLAHMEVRDGGSYVYASGTNKGLSVLDTTWKLVKELYVRDSGAWHFVHPLRATTANVSLTDNGSCPSTSSFYRATFHLIGPLPQTLTDTGSFFEWKAYRRQSLVSLADLLGKAWSFLSTSSGITTTSYTTPNSGNSFVLGGPTINVWTQFEGRINHSLNGEMTAAEGGIATTTVKVGKIDECGLP